MDHNFSSWYRPADFGISYRFFAIILRAIEYGKLIEIDLSIVNFEVGYFLTVWRPPNSIRSLKNLFFVQPIGNTIVDFQLFAIERNLVHFFARNTLN